MPIRVLIMRIRVLINANKGTDNANKGTDNANKGTGHANKGTCSPPACLLPDTCCPVGVAMLQANAVYASDDADDQSDQSADAVPPSVTAERIRP